jgi:hypothetical protein
MEAAGRESGAVCGGASRIPLRCIRATVPVCGDVARMEAAGRESGAVYGEASRIPLRCIRATVLTWEVVECHLAPLQSAIEAIARQLGVTVAGG